MKKNPTFLFKPVCAGSQKHFFAMTVRGKSSLLWQEMIGYYMVYTQFYLLTGEIQRHMTKKDLPQNNGD